MNKLKIIFFLLCYTNINSQTPPQEVSDTLQGILNLGIPSSINYSGAVMEVYVPGQWKWNGASGIAISGNTVGQPLASANPTDKFRVGSISKTMMATCILKLQEQGLLNIEDPISMYLRSTMMTDTIVSSGIVKIRHLLNHTSGIANSGDNASCSANFMSNPSQTFTLEESIYCGASQAELFAPDNGWHYSNTNYSILALIVQNVTGMTWPEFLMQTIITPLGLTNTAVPTTTQIIGPHMGCYWGASLDLTIVNATAYKGWADVVSTTSDLIIFSENLRNGNIINSNSLSLMKTFYTSTNQYGLGYDYYTYYGIDMWGHYGEVGNTSSLFYVNTSSPLAPNGYYISTNYNIQGADDINWLLLPVLRYLKDPAGSISSIEKIKSEFDIYPNPAKNELNIRNNSNSNSNENTYILSDELGKIIFQSTNLGLINYAIDCSTFNRGIYTLSIQTNSTTEYHKLILN